MKQFISILYTRFGTNSAMGIKLFVMPLTQYATREILFYKTDDGFFKVEILLYQENLWLTQSKMGELFKVQKTALSKHLKNIFLSGELTENSVVSVLETTATDGKNIQQDTII